MKTKLFILALLGSALACPVAAQTIEIDELGDAQAYSAGLMDSGSGGLDTNAWQGTSAELATHVVSQLPKTFEHPVAQELIRAALLSSGVPPEGDEAKLTEYRRARTDYLLSIGEAGTLAKLAERDLDLARDRKFRTDLALEQGRIADACATANGITEGRAEPYWAKLRAFCHAEAGEVAAAELTADLVLSSGHNDPVFGRLLDAMTKGRAASATLVIDTALHRAMKSAVSKNDDTEQSADAQLQRLLSQMEGQSPEDILPGMSALAAGVEAASYGYDDARDDDSALGTARLYVLAVSNRDAMAAGEFLSRMDQQGRFEPAAAHLAPILQTLAGEAAAQAGLDVMTRAAVLRNDLGMLAGLYRALEEGTDDADRLALISDALGGGFRFTPVGEDIEQRLIAGGDASGRAVRDTLIAIALGAQISDKAAIKLESARLSGVGDKAGQLLVLEAAAREGARAEVAMRAGTLLAGKRLDAQSLSRVIAALQEAGLDRYARTVAAYDFAERL